MPYYVRSPSIFHISLELYLLSLLTEQMTMDVTVDVMSYPTCLLTL